MAHARSAEASTETGRERPLRLRPRFIVLLVALRYLLPAVVVGAVLGAMGGVLIGFVTHREAGGVLDRRFALATDGEFGAVLLPVAGGGALLVWGLFVLGTALRYARTEYRLYDDRIEYEEGVLGRKYKELPWSGVTECMLRQGMLQRAWGVGTIVLATPATGPNGSAGESGMEIMDVPEPEWVYAEVRERVRRARESRGEAAHPARV